MLRKLLRGGDLHQQTAVLEVGCGTGNYICAFQELSGCDAAGVDPSASMLARARRRASAVAFRRARAEALPFPDASFDLIFSVDVIHHVQDRPAFFREAVRLLRPGGRFCTVTDSAEDIRQRRPLSSHFPETVPLELARYPAIAELRTLLQGAGLQFTWVESVAHEYLLSDIQPYREKAFSSLHLIPEEAFQRGVQRLAAELAQGPIPCVSLYTLVWAGQGRRGQ